MRQFFGTILALMTGLSLYSQECKLVLSGHIEDADSKEKLSLATVYIRELNVSFTTDDNGDFKYHDICPGTYTLEVSHAGCETVKKPVTLTKNIHVDILLPHLRYNLQEVVVEGYRPPPKSGFREQLDVHSLEAARTSSISEALAKLNGITLLQTGSTISKPVIHGLHSSRVLTINNGIRQEGQQWGNEHAPEIDPYVADKLSVVKGVDALRYGSDAIGGVVLIEPRAIRSLPGYYGELNSAFSTNNLQYVLSGIFEHQPVKFPAFSYRLQGTVKRAGNVNTPGYRLNNTGMNEVNFSLSANWKKEHYQLQAYYSEFNTTIGIFPGSHIGNLTDLLTIIPQSRPNEIFLGEKTYSIGRPRQEVLHRLFKLKGVYSKNKHKFNFTFGSQYNHRDEFDIIRNRNNTRPQVRLAIITFSEEVSYEHPAFHHITGTVGVSMMQQDNSYSGRYLIPNYLSGTYGGYWIEKWNHKKWDVEAGFRFDHKQIETKRLRYNGTRADHDFDFSTIGTSLNTGYRFTDQLRANINGSITSRAPQVNELLIDGIHEGAGTYELGDIHLQPEHSYNLSAGLSYTSRDKALSTEIYLYHNRIDNFIYQQPKPDEPVLTIVGAFPKIQFEQTDALLRGMDFSVNYRVVSPLQLSSRLSILRARNRATNDWLILMPADRWRNEVVYDFPAGAAFSAAYLSAEVVSVFSPRVPSDAAGKQDYKEPPGPYSLVSINSEATWKIFGKPLTMGLSVRNLFNQAYRDYLNSFRYYADEMGRNITLRIKIPFQKNSNK